MSVYEGRHPGPMPAISGRRTGLSARGRALPITVAAGLAMGVFAGLVVVRGTGQAAGTDSGPVAAVDPGGSGTGTGGSSSTGATPPPTPPTPATAGAQDAGTAAQNAATADAAPAAPTVAHVSFTIDPPDATIEVDGKPVTDGVIDVPLDDSGSATIHVSVKARGYHSVHKRYTVRSDQTFKLELHKAHRPSHPTGPGGLIKL